MDLISWGWLCCFRLIEQLTFRGSSISCIGVHYHLVTILIGTFSTHLHTTNLRLRIPLTDTTFLFFGGRGSPFFPSLHKLRQLPVRKMAPYLNH